MLLKLKSEQRSTNYISPAWSVVNFEINNTNEAKSVISKYWLIGFTPAYPYLIDRDRRRQAEGSFYLVSKDSTRIVHSK